MRNIFTLIASLLFFVMPLYSQNENNTKEHAVKEQKFIEFKMKYLAQEMDLKDDQKQKFYDLYQEMLTQIKQVKHQTESLRKQIRNTPGATEEDYKKLRDSEKQSNEEVSAIEKSYEQKFSQFLSEKQMYQMKEAEKKFRNRMQEMRHEHKKKNKPIDK